MKAGTVLDGRSVNCPACGGGRRTCNSCTAQIRYGKPNPNGKWEGLWMSDADWRRLLMAAAEYQALSEEESGVPNVVEFVDWLRPEVVRERAA